LHNFLAPKLARLYQENGTEKIFDAKNPNQKLKMKIENRNTVFQAMPEPENFSEASIAILLAVGMKAFNPGKLVCTPLAMETFTRGFFSKCLCRHIVGDWGDLDAEDTQTNDEALNDGGRLLSSYTHPVSKERLWIITEHDRSATTVMLPMEY
jgi:hypothetical protein